MTVSAIIPAYNEEEGIALVLQALQDVLWVKECIVVDDGSTDGTAEIAVETGGKVIRLPTNRGKAEALRIGLGEASHPIILMLDGDLRTTANAIETLLLPVLRGRVDMTIGILPPVPDGGGFGITLNTTRWLLRALTGASLKAPLSGQRACRRFLLESLPDWGERFGFEMALTLHAFHSGAVVREVEFHATHRVTKNDAAGFYHRGRQLLDIGRATWVWKRVRNL